AGDRLRRRLVVGEGVPGRGHGAEQAPHRRPVGLSERPDDELVGHGATAASAGRGSDGRPSAPVVVRPPRPPAPAPGPAPRPTGARPRPPAARPPATPPPARSSPARRRRTARPAPTRGWRTPPCAARRTRS